MTRAKKTTLICTTMCNDCSAPCQELADKITRVYKAKNRTKMPSIQTRMRHRMGRARCAKVTRTSRPKAFSATVLLRVRLSVSGLHLRTPHPPFHFPRTSSIGASIRTCSSANTMDRAMMALMIYIYIYIYTHTYIYESNNNNDNDNNSSNNIITSNICVYVYICIYIYI